METLRDLLTKIKFNKKTIIIILLLLYQPVTDFSILISEKSSITLLKKLFSDIISEEFKKAETKYSLKLLELETKDCRKAEDIDNKVEFWIKEKWNAQLSALQIIITNKYALEELKKIMYNEDVYKALISYAK